MEKFDIGIIGGGPAGYTAGMLYAKQGKSVVLFEKDKLGGTCLNKGCIPTKSMLHYSNLFAELKKSDFINNISDANLNFTKIIEKKNNTVEKIRKSLEITVKNSGVKIICSEACLKNKNSIIANDVEYYFDKIILATGSIPKEIKGLEFDHKFILSSDDILNLEELPKSILIVGSGAIGIEWARIFSNFGVDVTLVEMAKHLIPLADIEVSKRIERLFKKQEIKFYLNDYVKDINDKTAILNSGVEITPGCILIAVGRAPICISCNDTTILGDACGEIQLAHYAIWQAKAEALGLNFNKTLVPSVIYGEPEIAWVGIREQDMDENCKKIMLPITALGKSWCDDSTEGFIKLIVHNEKIIGAHIVSKEASSLIHIILIAIQFGITIDELKTMCFAHPTYAEGISEILQI